MPKSKRKAETKVEEESELASAPKVARVTKKKKKERRTRALELTEGEKAFCSKPGFLWKDAADHSPEGAETAKQQTSMVGANLRRMAEVGIPCKANRHAFEFEEVKTKKDEIEWVMKNKTKGGGSCTEEMALPAAISIQSSIGGEGNVLTKESRDAIIKAKGSEPEWLSYRPKYFGDKDNNLQFDAVLSGTVIGPGGEAKALFCNEQFGETVQVLEKKTMVLIRQLSRQGVLFRNMKWKEKAFAPVYTSMLAYYSYGLGEELFEKEKLEEAFADLVAETKVTTKKDRAAVKKELLNEVNNCELEGKSGLEAEEIMLARMRELGIVRGIAQPERIDAWREPEDEDERLEAEENMNKNGSKGKAARICRQLREDYAAYYPEVADPFETAAAVSVSLKTTASYKHSVEENKKKGGKGCTARQLLQYSLPRAHDKKGRLCRDSTGRPLLDDLTPEDRPYLNPEENVMRRKYIEAAQLPAEGEFEDPKVEHFLPGRFMRLKNAVQTFPCFLRKYHTGSAFAFNTRMVARFGKNYFGVQLKPVRCLVVFDVKASGAKALGALDTVITRDYEVEEAVSFGTSKRKNGGGEDEGGEGVLDGEAEGGSASATADPYGYGDMAEADAVMHSEESEVEE